MSADQPLYTRSEQCVRCISAWRCCCCWPGVGLPVPTSAPPTAIPLSALDLEPLLIQSGDLPAGIEPAQVFDAPPPAFKEYPTATKAIYQRLQRGGKTVGGVVVFLYEQDADRTKAIALAIRPDRPEHRAVADLGEQADAFMSDVIALGGVAFVRCRAVVDVTLSASADEIVAYAKRLDKRLTPLVC